MSADLLGQGAAAWRGRPAVWGSGDMAGVGERFDAAFSEFSPGLPVPLVFEYFTGLVFNADYGDLVGLKAVVDGWLEVTDVRLRFHHADIVHVLSLFPDYLEFQEELVPFTGARLRHATPVYEDPLNPGWRCRIFSLYWPHLEAGYNLQLWEVREDESLVQQIYSWYGQWWWTYLRGAVHVEGWPYPWGIYVEPGIGGRVFYPTVKAACREYILSQEGFPRDFPEPLATAETDNGWLFLSWAQGRFGIPGAY